MTTRVAFCFAAILGFVLSCTSDHPPELPSNTDTAAIAERVNGSDGQAFLRSISTAAWKDDGRQAAELFAWVPRDATSSDPASATRAGQSAHAIASFLSDNRETVKTAPANSALWQAFSHSLVPYLGAMVGDPRGTRAFEPLDAIDSPLKRTVSLFATMTKDAGANRGFTDAADALAHEYEAAFAKVGVADPANPASDDALRKLLRAAYLRALVDAGRYLADPDSPRPTPTHAQLELTYQIVSLTARPDDPHINPEFFREGHLLAPTEIAQSDLSIYNSQLSTYLVTYPKLRELVREFGRRYDLVAG
jgi:hypothetical protein